MEEKDPKDMATSELLRLAVDGYEGSKGTVIANLIDLMGLDGYEWHGRCLRRLADKIDAELAQARKEAVKESKKPMWWFRSAIECGEDWPEPREGESFRSYLERCFLPRPRYEDGEPVLFCDEWKAILISLDGARFRLLNTFPDGLCFAGDPVKRPEVLGADGKPIVAGETVHRLTDGTAWKVTKLHHSEPRISVVSVGGKGVTAGGWFLANEYTHTPPDTQERIDEDARKAYCSYWGCGDSPCINCPVKIDGGRPKHRYGVPDCEIAQTLDLLRRQRELDKRIGGAE